MNLGDAKVLTAKMAAAWPRDWLGAASYEVYATFIAELPDADVASDAVDVLIREARRLPSVAEVREVYRRAATWHEQPALEEPPLSEEERQDNLRRLSEMSRVIGGSP